MSTLQVTGEADPRLGVLIYDDSVGADAVLAESAAILAHSGMRLAGVVQSNPARPGRSRCDMNLRDLTTGVAVSISLDLGEDSAGCRLDSAAMARASFGVEQALEAGADLLIVNRFGKQEAQGQGFRSVIAAALTSGIPVVLGVSRLNLQACLEFAGYPVARLAADPDAIAAWCRAAIANPVGQANEPCSLSRCQ